MLSINSTFGQKKQYNNPIIPGFNPDPSICKVGDDYYLATSSFEYFPGVPIYHSTDLVNWQMVGHALRRPEQLDLESIPSTAGIYAPTLRYHDGTYYMITTLITEGQERPNKPAGNFVVTAKNPAGPWSNPIWIESAPGIDPSLFFDDDGKVYYCGNSPPEIPNDKPERQVIWIQEIALPSFKLIGKKSYLESKKYHEQDIIGSPMAFEAPHIYKKEGIYYLLIAHGGTGMGHAVSIWKSKSPFGPWEDNPDNPILTHRGYSESGINCTGHADVFQIEDGSWWSVLLAVRSDDKKNNVMGRETFLAPVDWSGTWPIFNPKGTVGRITFTHDAPSMMTNQKNNTDFEDTFDQKKLNLAWTMIRTPETTWWDLETDPGNVSIKLRPDQIEQFAQPSFLGIRAPDMKMKATTTLNFDPKQPNECAGLAFERGHDAEWTLIKEQLDNKLVVSVYQDGKELLGQVLLQTNNTISLKIELINFKMTFSVKESDTSWQTVAEAQTKELLGFPKAGRFTGSFVGLYASSRGKKSNNKAVFENFSLAKLTK